MSISIINRIIEQYRQCRTDECRKAKANWLVWHHGEYLPAIRADLERHGQTDDLLAIDEMLAIYKPLPDWPVRVHCDYSKIKR